MQPISRRSLVAALIPATGSAAAQRTPRRQAARSAGTSIRNHPLDGIKRENIKITNVKMMHLSYRMKPEEQWADGDNHTVYWKTEAQIAIVFTDAGITGLGSCNQLKDPPESMPEYTRQVIAPILAGKNPFDVEALTGGISHLGKLGAWAGVDVALWDIIAKSKGMPLYRLLAIDTEPVSRIPVYASGGEFSWRKDGRFPGPDDLIRQALSHKRDGYKAFKFRMGAGFNKLGIRIADFVPYLRSIRQAVGSEFGLIMEANMRWTVAQCLEIAPVLEELRFLWFEEPTKRSPPDYLTIKKALPTVKISGGEKRRTRFEISEMVDNGAYDIVQHSADDAGMTEAWHMARMAHTRGVLLCTHNWGDQLMAVENAHLMAAAPNRFLLEMNMTPDPLKEATLKNGPVAKDGYLDLLDKPGLGVELKEGLEEMYPVIPGRWTMTGS